MNEAECYIMADGIRIGFFYNREAALEGMRYCQKGMIIGKKEWEATQ